MMRFASAKLSILFFLFFTAVAPAQPIPRSAIVTKVSEGMGKLDSRSWATLQRGMLEEHYVHLANAEAAGEKLFVKGDPAHGEVDVFLVAPSGRVTIVPLFAPPTKDATFLQFSSTLRKEGEYLVSEVRGGMRSAGRSWQATTFILCRNAATEKVECPLIQVRDSYEGDAELPPVNARLTLSKKGVHIDLDWAMGSRPFDWDWRSVFDHIPGGASTHTLH